MKSSSSPSSSYTTFYLPQRPSGISCLPLRQIHRSLGGVWVWDSFYIWTWKPIANSCVSNCRAILCKLYSTSPFNGSEVLTYPLRGGQSWIVPQSMASKRWCIVTRNTPIDRIITLPEGSAWRAIVWQLVFIGIPRCKVAGHGNI